MNKPVKKFGRLDQNVTFPKQKAEPGDVTEADRAAAPGQIEEQAAGPVSETEKGLKITIASLKTRGFSGDSKEIKAILHLLESLKKGG